MSRFLFYKSDEQPGSRLHVQNPSLRMEIWKPGIFRVKPPGVPGRAILAYWVFHWLRVFKNSDYTFLLLFKGDRLVHYSAAYPGYFRFPFMAKNDLQIGYVWTDPNCRGEGLATCGVSLLASAVASTQRSIWYIVSQENSPSICIAEKLGFHLVGTGDVQRGAIISALSKYRIAERLQATTTRKAV